MGLNYHADHFYTHTFTPPEYQVELIAKLKERNTIVCLNTHVSKSFVAVKVVQELAHEMRATGGRRAFYICAAHHAHTLSSHIRLLTDLSVATLEKIPPADEWQRTLRAHIIILLTAEVCEQLLATLHYDVSFMNILIIDDCFAPDQQKHLDRIVAHCRRGPRVIGLVSGFLSEDLKPMHLEAEMSRLETLLHAKIDTSSELCTLVKLSCEPIECMIAFDERPCPDAQLSAAIRAEIRALSDFLRDHRYDLLMIYGNDCDELAEELKQIPDPSVTPLRMLADFERVLDEFGVLGAHYAAVHLLHQIEKLRVKVAYERHFLLLLAVQTLMVKVRALVDDAIGAMKEYDALRAFASGRVERLIELLRALGPSDQPRPTPPVLSEAADKPPEVVYTKGRRHPRGGNRRFYHRPQQDDGICALIFVRNSLTAKVVHSILSTVMNGDETMWWLGVQFIVDKTADPATEMREAELEHRRQEEVLRKFRAHECNILIATPVLEQGYDLPKCNLVLRLDAPPTFHSYVYTKARARTSTSYYVTLVHSKDSSTALRQLAEFKVVQKILLSRCGQVESNTTSVIYSDLYCNQFRPYITPSNEVLAVNAAIQLINRYCAKLPSDAFTKLVPAYHSRCVNGDYRCYLRLPINSPVKLTVEGPLAPSEVAAKKMAAFFMCQLLHKSAELDDHLNPITKENFRATEPDWNDFALEKEDEELSVESIEQRPGTTKRRQYYFKRVASALRDCLPTTAACGTYFYRIVMTLTCPIPEEQNTRGRRIYPPEESAQGFGLLTAKQIPPICPFPIFTRSGEVNVALDLCAEGLQLTAEQCDRIREFQNYTFTSVLRLQKYQMHFEPARALSNFFTVPTIRSDDGARTFIDWEFLEVIFAKRYDLPTHIPDAERKCYVFDAQQYRDAVVMPWYRNQDQPQYFYVAEICKNLSPASAFPGSDYGTFRDYYFKKYNIEIQNNEQHLLDVDHTSARLNFLTPRYVNRKGVALPTSSEETKRAKRENLEQKQILVPELCAIHPFPASLWRMAVCLPCILYRINALLIADEIRCVVAQDIKLGREKLERTFVWDALNFGWSLSDVLNKSKPLPKSTSKLRLEVTDIIEDLIERAVTTAESKSSEEEDESEDDAEKDPNWMEIGTWSNDMLNNDTLAGGATTPSSSAPVRYGSPTHWMDDSYSYSDTDSLPSSDEEGNDSQFGGLHIKFQDDYQAEAVEEDAIEDDTQTESIIENTCATWADDLQLSDEYQRRFDEAVNTKYEALVKHNYLRADEAFAKGAALPTVDVARVPTGSLIALYDYRPIKIRDAAVNNAKLEPAVGNDDSPPAKFSFDAQPDLDDHPGPSPSFILQALTMSNANDGINLERLETIGDSFLKYAITDYLYTRYENTHEGKLSHLRSKQVSNLNLYRLGKRKQLGMMMIASKFDPHDNWLPPCYCVSKELEEVLSQSCIPGSYLTLADYVETRHMTLEELCTKFRSKADDVDETLVGGLIPYNLVTQHSIPDKSIADCVEALIGAYLIECGPRGALLFMAWLGIRVLPRFEDGSYGELNIPDSPLLRHLPDPEGTLRILLDGYERFEQILGYQFYDRSYLLQALTHASYSPNTITDCYQRLEFLGDAVLDYLITRHLYEDQRMHSPGALTDLRSALVNNTIFASLAVKYEFHKYFRYLSPGLHLVIEKFIRTQEDAGHKVSDDLYLLDVEESEEVEDVEVPKVLGDVFESVAGAIFLDSGRSLDAVWRVYYKMMRSEIEQFSNKVPKSPIRELLELEPETAKFGRAEKLADGRRVRVSVEVFGKGTFKGIGRNYRIAKCTAAKCALKHLKKQAK